MELDFEIDKITESIELAATGERFETRVVPVLRLADLKGVSKKSGWRFDWRDELAMPERHVYKLVTEKEQEIIQGLVSFRIANDHVYMHLIENAPFNTRYERKGEQKLYEGVCPNLVAYGCKMSKELGFGGVLSFVSKTKLVEYYKEKLGAEVLFGDQMAIFEKRAIELINQYFHKKDGGV